jgi:tRNA G18 (ribose-2'-O)-methylase SpoU
MPQIPVHDLDDPRLACYRDLSERNLTRQSGLFIAEGEKVSERLFASSFETVSVLTEPTLAIRYAAALPQDVPVYVASQDLVQATVGFNFHRGIVACGRRQPDRPVEDLLAGLRSHHRSTLVVCPDVQDPTNLGSIIRSAAAFGCAGVVLGGKCADPFSRRVLRVSMGAVLQVPIVESRNLAADLASLAAADFDLVATVLDHAAEPLVQACRGPRLAVIFGSEGHGLADEWLAKCHRRVTVPMQLGIDSLNVAVAAAVVLYEFTRPCLRPA